MSFKRKIQALAFSVFALIVVIIVIRIFFVFINEDSTASIVRFWIDDLSQPLIDPFVGIYNNYLIDGLNIEASSFLAMLIYLLVGYIAAKIAGAFVPLDPRFILFDLIDVAFKIAEFVLILRLIFRLTNARLVSDFVQTIYDISFIFYEPFENILPSITFGDAGAYIFETSTFIAVVLIIIFDLITEGILKGVLGLNEINYSEEQRRVISQPSVTNVNLGNNPYPMQNSQPMNITVNVPNQNPGQNQQPATNVNNYFTQPEDINRPSNRA